MQSSVQVDRLSFVDALIAVFSTSYNNMRDWRMLGVIRRIQNYPAAERCINTKIKVYKESMLSEVHLCFTGHFLQCCNAIQLNKIKFHKIKHSFTESWVYRNFIISLEHSLML